MIVPASQGTFMPGLKLPLEILHEDTEGRRLACLQQRSACVRATLDSRLEFTGSPGGPVFL